MIINGNWVLSVGNYIVSVDITITSLWINLNGFTSILGSHLGFGDPRRGWDFVSRGHGDVDLEAIIRVLNRIGYNGPLSVEGEDNGMDREHGA